MTPVILTGRGIQNKIKAIQFVPERRREVFDFLMGCKYVLSVKSRPDSITIHFTYISEELKVLPWDWIILYSSGDSIMKIRSDEEINTLYYVSEDE